MSSVWLTNTTVGTPSNNVKCVRFVVPVFGQPLSFFCSTKHEVRMSIRDPETDLYYTMCASAHALRPPHEKLAPEMHHSSNTSCRRGVVGFSSNRTVASWQELEDVLGCEILARSYGTYSVLCSFMASLEQKVRETRPCVPLQRSPKPFSTNKLSVNQSTSEERLIPTRTFLPLRSPKTPSV